MDVDLHDLDRRMPAIDFGRNAMRPRAVRGRKERGVVKRRRHRTHRRDFVGGVAVTATMMVAAAFLFLSGSCGGPPP